MRIGQPGVKRHDSCFRAESGNEQGEGQEVGRADVVAECIMELAEVERAVIGIKH